MDADQHLELLDRLLNIAEELFKFAHMEASGQPHRRIISPEADAKIRDTLELATSELARARIALDDKAVAGEVSRTLDIAMEKRP